MKYFKNTKIFLIYAAVIMVSAGVAFPFFWLLVTSFKTYPEIYKFPITYFPHRLTLEHYQKILGLYLLRYFGNSLLIASGTLLLTLVIALLPAYAFANLQFQAKKTLAMGTLIFIMFPQVAFVVPFFLLLKKFGLINTYWGIMISYLPFTCPMAMLYLRAFFLTVPKELEESAMLEGCSRIGALFRISVPLLLPGIAATGIYAFIFSWGELMFALSYLPSASKQTVPVFLSLFIGQYHTRWGALFAGSTIDSLPPIIIFVFLQKYFIAGLARGAVKE